MTNFAISRKIRYDYKGYEYNNSASHVIIVSFHIVVVIFLQLDICLVLLNKLKKKLKNYTKAKIYASPV